MKKAILLILAVLTLAFLLFTLRIWAPFMTIAGKSMEPELRVGDLILIKKINPREIHGGDIIVFSVPRVIREHYNYSPIVAHRVHRIYEREDSIIFRTKGDNTGEDPFIVRTSDLRGIVGRRIPYVGILPVFLQSTQGFISITVIFLIIFLATYWQEIGRAKYCMQKEIFAPVLKEQDDTKQALNSFAVAMGEYAKHLASHTQAVQSLAASAEALRKVTEELAETKGVVIPNTPATGEKSN